MDNKKTNESSINYIQVIGDMLYIIVGTLIMTFAINVLLVPNKLSTGGASGIATIFYYIANMPIGISVFLLNLPLFIISIVKFGFKFSAKSIFTTVLLSIFLEVFKFQKIVDILNIDLFISSIFGGLLIGISESIILKAGSSSGGSDLLSQIIYKLTSAQSISKIMLVIDTLIILSIVVVFRNINLGLYSIVSIFISNKVIDIVFEGIYYTKVVNIITNKPKQIIDDIFVKLLRGATITEVKGAYTDKKYSQVTVIVSLPEIGTLKRIIRQNDNKALVYISNVNEVLGNGFKEI